MSEDRSDAGLDSMEGWSIVRHRDDVGSDADSVEVISDDSDRETCDEGKEAGDDDHKTEVADSTTNESTSTLEEEGVGTTDDGDLDSALVRLDPLGDFTQRLSDKLHEFLLIPRNVHNDRANQELKLRYVIFASTLLALICSLLVSSYLLFHKFQELTERRNDPTSTQVLQELEQAISRLQSVLRVENNEHVKDSLSRMPPDYLSLDKMISNDRINRRKSLRRSQAIPTKVEGDFGVIMSIETSEITSEGHEESDKGDGSPRDSKLTGNGMSRGVDQEKLSNLPTGQLPQPDRPPEIAVGNAENPSKDETHNSDTLLPVQELKTQHETYDSKSPDLNKKDSKLPNSETKNILQSVRQDILSIQNYQIPKQKTYCNPYAKTSYLFKTNCIHKS
uniref:Uncharacterized protein n=1 Tax=Lygus hesperus TaxID=30085 RepID=A0A146KZY3_LYGHE